MKKKPPDFSDRPRRKFFPCRLYAIDLEEMISAARERKLNFSIADEKYVYDSIDEVKVERGERVMKTNAHILGAGSGMEQNPRRD